MCTKNKLTGLLAASILLITACAFSSSKPSEPAATGFYVLGQGGDSWTGFHDPSLDLNQTIGGSIGPFSANFNSHAEFDDSGGMERIAIGYKLNRFFSLESGFSHLPGTLLSVNTNANGMAFSSFVSSEASLMAEQSVYVFDLMAKAYWPITNKWFMYVGVGAAYEHIRSTITASGDGYSLRFLQRYFDTITFPANIDQTHSRIQPKVAVGGGYNFTPHFALTTEYSYIFGKTDNLYPAISVYPPISAIMFGLQYTF